MLGGLDGVTDRQLRQPELPRRPGRPGDVVRLLKIGERGARLPFAARSFPFAIRVSTSAASARAGPDSDAIRTTTAAATNTRNNMRATIGIRSDGCQGRGCRHGMMGTPSEARSGARREPVRGRCGLARVSGDFG